MFETVEKFRDLIQNFEKHTSTEGLKDAGKSIKQGGESLWKKAKTLTE
ncbi:hypothetical protein [uncultured Algibacter sp.]